MNRRVGLAGPCLRLGVSLCVFSFLLLHAWADERLSPQALHQKALQAERAGLLEEALQVYQEAIRAGGDYPVAVAARVRVARIFMIQRLDADAQKHLDEALLRDPENSEALMMQARLHMLQDKPRRATTIYENLIRREPVAVEAAVGLVATAVKRQEPAVIRQATNRLRALTGDSPEKRARAAQSAREEADFLVAAVQLETALALGELALSFDATPSGKEFLAMLRYQANQLDESARLFQELLEVPKSKDVAQAMLNQIEIQRKESRLVDKRRQWLSLQAAAREHEIAGRLEEAIRSYEEMMTFGKDLFGVEIADVERRLASAKRRHAEKAAAAARTQAFEFMRSKKYLEAADVLRRAKAFVGPDLVLDGMLAEALLKRSAVLDASAKESAMREILALDDALRATGGALPTLAVGSAHAELGALMESAGRWKEAVRHFEMADARGSTLPFLHRHLLLARLRMRAPAMLAALAAALGLAALVHLKWPGVFRFMVAYVQYTMALRQRDKDRQYRALSALAAIRPGRTDYRIRLARMADERKDADVSLYLHEQLWRERSLNSAGMYRLFEMYSERKEMDKIYELSRDLLRASPSRAIQTRVLDARFRHELEHGRRADAYQSGCDLMSIKPSAWLAEQMVMLAKTMAAKPDLPTLLTCYKQFLRLSPTATEKTIADAEPILSAAWPKAKAEMDPPVRDLAKFLIDLNLKVGSQKRATELMEALRPYESDPVPSLQSLMKLYKAMGNDEALLRTARMLHEAQKANLGFGVDYAALLLTRDDVVGAVSVFLDLLPHHPNNVELVKQLMETARLRFDGGAPADLELTIRILRSLIGITLLDTKEARLLLARSLMKKNLMDEAIAILQAIEGGGYHKIRAQSLAAEAFLQKNQPGLAAELLSKVNFDDPQMSDEMQKEMRYLQAIALEAQGFLPEAAEILDDLILKDILFRDVKDRHARLAHVKRRKDAQVECASCGKPNSAGAKFCAHCGAPASS